MYARGVSSGISSRRHTRPRPRLSSSSRCLRMRYVRVAVCAKLRAGTVARSKSTDGTVRRPVLRAAEERRFARSRSCRTSHHVVTSLPRTISIGLKRLYGLCARTRSLYPLSFSLPPPLYFSLFLSPVSGRVKINAERWPRAGGALENQSKSSSPRGAISWPTGGPSVVLSLPMPAALITSTRALVPCLPQRYQGLRAQSQPALSHAATPH